MIKMFTGEAKEKRERERGLLLMRPLAFVVLANFIGGRLLHVGYIYVHVGTYM